MQSTDATAPAVDADVTAARQAYETATAQAGVWQAQAGQFLREHGADVLAGHTPVTAGQGNS